MEIEWSEEQAMLAQSARDRMAAVGFDRVRSWMQSELGYDRALYHELAQLGWLGVAVEERFGGAAMGRGSLVALCEAMGRVLLSTPFLATTLASELLSRAGSEAQRMAWLPRLVSGEIVATVALYEPDGSFELTAPTLEARRDGAAYRLRGSKLQVLDAIAAEVIVVSAQLDGAAALFLLERAKLPQGALRRHVLIDETRRAYRLELDDVPLPAEARLDAGDAADALRAVYQLGALLVAAEMAGGMSGVMDLTLEYLQTRKQFGKLIGGYQALKHPMVDILVMYEEARSLLYHAATLIDRQDSQDSQHSQNSEGSERCAALIHMAKARCGEAFAHATDRAIQFHGAIGFTYECHAQLFFRRAQWAQYSFGDSRHHERKLEALLLDGDAPLLVGRGAVTGLDAG